MSGFPNSWSMVGEHTKLHLRMGAKLSMQLSLSPTPSLLLLLVHGARRVWGPLT